MRNPFFSRLLPILLCLALAQPVLPDAPAQAAPRGKSTLTGRVVWVYDGDTVDVLTPSLDVVRVRLYGVDCPESEQPHGLMATLFVVWHTFLRHVEVRVMDRDRYGRTVGWLGVPSKGKNLNSMLVEEGQAWVYEQYCKTRECTALRLAEKQARQQRLGLWLDPDPTPPWEWRKQKRGQRRGAR